MKAFLLHIAGEAATATRDHLENFGWDVEMFEGFDNKNKWSLRTNHTYDLDDPDADYRIGPTETGNILAHWVLWRALEHFGQDDHYHIMESDVRLRVGWARQLGVAMRNLPENWDMLYPGSCCKHPEEDLHVAENLYKGAPLCTHYYVVRHKALRTLIDTNSSAWGPIDIQIQQGSAPKLDVYTILPRLADQYNTVID